MATREELTKLFGTPPEKVTTEALIFEEPEKAEWQMATDNINEGMTKNQAWAMCQALQPLLRSRGAVLVKMRSNGKMRPATELERLFRQGANKMDMSQALALILCVPANLQHYVDSLNDYQRELWSQLLSRLFITEREALRILHTSQLFVKEKNRNYYYYETEKISPPELMFLKGERYLSSTLQRYGYRQRETFITFPAAIYPYFIKVFHPETNNEVWLTRQQLPKDGYTVCNFEMDSVAKFPLIQGLLNAGKLPMKAKGIGMSDIKRTAKSLGLMEIFGNDAVKGSEQENLRARYYIEMIAQDYHYNSYSKKQQKDPMEYVLRRIFDKQFGRYCYVNLIPLLLPHIKGLRRQITEENELNSLIKDYLDLLKTHHKSWISIADALQQTLGNVKDAIIPFKAMVFDPDNMSELYDITNEFSKKVIGPESFVSEFGLTALQAFSLLLCSLGMAEVALSPLHRPESPFARAEFIRLTDLGRYALSIAKKYESPHFDQQAYFELDPDRLIIRSIASPNPYEQLLKDSSVAISKNRYETSASSFLAHCKSREDVEKNISIFRQFISSDLPPLWKQFFDQLLQHCNPLKKDTTGYQHYQLSPDNTDLIRLITTDEKLRKLVVRAEDFRIMVKNSDLPKFEERLKAHGYLL